MGEGKRKGNRAKRRFPSLQIFWKFPYVFPCGLQSHSPPLNSLRLDVRDNTQLRRILGTVLWWLEFALVDQDSG